MPDVIVAGGGLAGMAASAALADAGCRVTLLEARGYLGGRASSFPLGPAGTAAEAIDNCQHILLGCCVNLLDFYRRVGVEDRIRFYREFNFLEPGGRRSTFAAGALPAPLHLAGSFARLPFLTGRAKLAILRALAAVRREYGRRQDLDRITMLDWLKEKAQPPDAVSRFWRPVLISAANAELDVMAARHGLQVFRLAFLGGGSSHEMGVPLVPLSELYSRLDQGRGGRLDIRLHSPVESIRVEGGAVSAVSVAGERLRAGCYVSALPFGRLAALAPDLQLDVSAFRHSPITGIHLWFDRPVTDLPHAALLDRTIQWMFNKAGGRYVHLVVSASHSLVAMGQAEIVSLARRELAEFFPPAGAALLLKARVVKEVRATFAPVPGLESLRPGPVAALKNLFLAGDWTRTGWPSTMEGAVRSGYAAAEAVSEAAGSRRAFLAADLA
ncbi:MAG: FAD-dependent oxidoreductase [Bryobacterales bacterium]|nr:FAD-dependent oxidoreductase [Bryobacterales bacterium]